MTDERINVYTCAEGHKTVTVERGEGVTPMLLRCRVSPGCSHMARSAFYVVADPKPTPTHEWYRPSDEEVDAMPAAHRDHYRRGGFAIRELVK